MQPHAAPTPPPRRLHAASTQLPRIPNAASTQPTCSLLAAPTPPPRSRHAAAMQPQRRCTQPQRRLHAAFAPPPRCPHASSTPLHSAPTPPPSSPHVAGGLEKRGGGLEKRGGLEKVGRGSEKRGGLQKVVRGYEVKRRGGVGESWWGVSWVWRKGGGSGGGGPGGVLPVLAGRVRREVVRIFIQPERVWAVGAAFVSKDGRLQAKSVAVYGSLSPSVRSSQPLD